MDAAKYARIIITTGVHVKQRVAILLVGMAHYAEKHVPDGNSHSDAHDINRCRWLNCRDAIAIKCCNCEPRDYRRTMVVMLQIGPEY